MRIYRCIVHMRAYALCVYIYTYVRLSTFTYVCIRTRVCLHIGVYVQVQVYICTYAYIGVYTHMYTYTRIRPAFGFYNQDCKTLQFKFRFSSAENVRVCVLRMYAYVHVYNGAYYIRVRLTRSLRNANLFVALKTFQFKFRISSTTYRKIYRNGWVIQCRPILMSGVISLLP